MQQQQGGIGSNGVANKGKNAPARAILVKLHAHGAPRRLDHWAVNKYDQKEGRGEKSFFNAQQHVRSLTLTIEHLHSLTDNSSLANY
jgi:hypothetical protein